MPIGNGSVAVVGDRRRGSGRRCRRSSRSARRGSRSAPRARARGAAAAGRSGRPRRRTGRAGAARSPAGRGRRARVSSARIDGAEYQTLIRRSARNSPSRAGSLPSASPIRTSVAALRHDANRSKTDRSKWNGACDAKRSSSRQGPSGLVAPVEEGEGVGVREHHALGLAGRARGVEDVGQVVGVARAAAAARARRRPGPRPRRRRRRRASRASSGPRPGGSVGPTTIRRGRGPGPGQASRRAAASAAATTTALTPPAAKMPAARDGRAGRVDRHVRRARTEDAVDRRDGLQPLGQEQPDAVAPADAPARQPGRQAVGGVRAARRKYSVRPCSSSTAGWSGRARRPRRGAG